MTLTIWNNVSDCSCETHKLPRTRKKFMLVCSIQLNSTDSGFNSQQKLGLQSFLDCGSASGLWMQHVSHKSAYHNIVLHVIAYAS